MKKFLFFAAFVTLTISVKAQLSYQWSGAAASNVSEYGQEIASDPSGNVYVTGTFSGTVDFDPGPGVSTLSGLSGSADIFLAKYNSSGTFIWVKQIGSTSTEKAYDLVADATGAYLAGTFMGNCNFNIGGPTNTITSLGGGTDGDGFFAKYDVNGSLLWVDRIGSIANDRVIGITVDALQNVFVTGFIGANADMDPGAPVVTLSVSGTYNAFFAKYTPAGAYTFAKQITGGYSEGDDIAVDVSGNIYLTGSFATTNDFDPGVGTANLTTSGLLQLDIFLAKYNSSGNYTFAKQIGGIGVDIGFQVMPDATGNIYLGGVFSNTCDFDPAPGFTTNIVSAGQGDLFVAKYDISGNFLWANGTGGTANDYCYGLGLDGTSNVYITGNCNGANIDFDPGVGVAALTSSVSSFYIASYNSSGAFNFVNSLGNINSDGKALEVNSSVYVTGFFSGTADFNFGVPTATITSAGGTDVFFAKYNLCGGVAPALPSAIAGATSICTGASQTYSVVNDPQAVNYLWTLPGGWMGTSTTNIISTVAGTTGIISVVANGTCGSSPAQTLAVTVNPLPVPIAGNNSPVCVNGTLLLTASGGSTYTWAGPVGYNSVAQNPTITNVSLVNGGPYTVVVTSAAGCTATAITNVTINPLPVATASNNSPVCIGNAINFTASGGATYTWTGPGGYTSLTQNPVIAVATLSNTGQYTVIVKSAANCTASAITNATVLPTPTPFITSNSPVCTGAPLTLSVSGGGGSFNWTGPNSFTSAVQNPTISNVQLVNAGNYSVLVTVGTCTATTNVSVSVNPSPTVTAICNNSLICPGQSVTITASGALTYSWSGGGNGTLQVVSPTLTTSYTITATGANGCTNSAVNTVSVNIPPTLNAVTNNTLLCVGQSATLTAGGANTYTWSTGNTGTNEVVSPTVTTTYTVTGTGTNNCTGSFVITQSVTVCSGLNALVKGKDEMLRIYPNPFLNEILVSVNNVNGIKKATFINATGQIILTKEMTENISTLNLTDLAKGIYFVKLYSDQGLIQTIKLIKE